MRKIGETGRELYFHAPDGQWTHSKADGRTFKELQDAMDDFDRTYAKSRQDRIGCTFLMLVVILAYIAAEIQTAL